MDHRLKKMARVGIVAKGAVYAISAVLIFLSAINMGGETPSKRGVLDFLKNQPFGETLLIVMAVGLIFYSAWRFIQAFSDPEEIGEDAKGILKRTGLCISGLIYLGLAGLAVMQVLDAGNSGSNGGGASSAENADFLATLPGLVLMGLVGAVLAVVGIIRFVRAFKGDFQKKFDTHSMQDDKRRRSIKVTAKIGMSARGLILLIVSFFALKGAFTANPDEIKTTSDVFSFIHESAYGSWLLGIVAIGMMAYAIYMFLLSKYRKFND